jgi:hypothetical protein
MDFVYQEEQTWPLTSDTTCYTGAKPSDEKGGCGALSQCEPCQLSWATQRHTCHIRLPRHNGSGTTGKSEEKTLEEQCHLRAGALLSSRTVPRKQRTCYSIVPFFSRLIVSSPHGDEKHANVPPPLECVGYSSTRDWEALALLESSIKSDTEQQPTIVLNNASTALPPPPPPHGPSTLTAASASSDVSTSPPSTMTPSVGGGSRHARSSSFASLSEASLTAPSKLFDTLTETTSHKPILVDAATDATEVTLTLEEFPLSRPTTSIVSQLILRRHDCTVEFSSALDFRPLAVTIFALGQLSSGMEPNDDEELLGQHFDNANDDHVESLNGQNQVLSLPPEVAVWVASADDCHLRLMVPSQTCDISPDSSNERTIVPVELQDPAFSFLTPVMAISHTSVATNVHIPTFCLAVACQDGTIRLVTYQLQRHENESLTLANVQHKQVIVDGPIVCIHARAASDKDGPLIHIAIGSLCGYAAELHVRLDTMELHGPNMIADSLWNARWNAEDSVLAVYATETTVVLGTQAGRCLLYQQQTDASAPKDADNVDDNKSYQLRWTSQLPYPIHGVTCLSDGQLVVTTRRSVHLFHKKDFLSYDPSAAAQAAKTRLTKLLQQDATET